MEHNLDSREHFAALVREHSRSMFRAARAILDCDADAEDAVGEAVLLAWQAFPKLKNQQAARCWLLKITVHCAYGQRRRQRKVVYMDDLSQTVGSVPPSESSGLWDAVLRLPEDQRLVVMLYYYEDLPVAEISKTLRVPQGTVKSRLSRGRERLRSLLREEDAYGL